MKNKRGWIRVLEATISVLLIMSVMLIVYTGDVQRDSGFDDYILTLENKILLEISSNDTLRELVLVNSLESNEALLDFISSLVPTSFDYSLNNCDLGSTCKLDENILVSVYEEDIFSKSTIISSNSQVYNPRKIRIFIWEKSSN